MFFLLDDEEGGSLAIVVMDYPRYLSSPHLDHVVFGLTTSTSAGACWNSFCNRQIWESLALMYVMSISLSLFLTIFLAVWSDAGAFFIIIKSRTALHNFSVVGEYVKGY